MSGINIQHFHHSPSGTLSYVVIDPATSRAAIIDPVLGFSVVSGRTDRTLVDEIVNYVRGNALRLDWILETHAHADHLSAAQLLRAELGGKVGIGAGILQVQAHFAGVFNLKPPFVADGRQFDCLFADDERFMLGEIECRVIHPVTPVTALPI